MKFSHIALALCLAVILGVPFLLSMGGGRGTHTEGAPTLIVFTPHVPQIRDEFARAFSSWHEREFGEKANLDFRTPGGTSEIVKQLHAMYTAGLDDLFASGNYTIGSDTHFALPPGTIAGDVMLGGGSYDHGKLRDAIDYQHTTQTGATSTVLNLKVSISAPASFTQEELDALFGENSIGPQNLYEPDQYWIGTALSSFGIVYNNDVLDELGLPVPEAFEDLTDPQLWGWIALADPRQSGSVTTTFDSILGNEGWEQGWRTLRAMSGNTRYFTNSSTKPPIDVSQGEAAAGLAIDFYGRGQAQVIKDSGGGDRVGYSDPRGAVYVDADPVSILNGGPNPELAMRFVRFCLSEEAQALWQFPHWDGVDSPANPTLSGTEELMGPQWYDLRRMPVRRVMYEKYFDVFVDRVDPFTLASDVKNPGWRTGVEVMMGCFGIDISKDCRAAYKALNDAGVSGKFTEAELAELDALYYAFPETRIEALKALAGFDALSEESKALIKEKGWKWQSQVVSHWGAEQVADSEGRSDLWNLAHVEHYEPFTQTSYRTVHNEWKQPRRQAELEIEYTRFYRDNYRELIRRVGQKK